MIQEINEGIRNSLLLIYQEYLKTTNNTIKSKKLVSDLILNHFEFFDGKVDPFQSLEEKISKLYIIYNSVETENDKLRVREQIQTLMTTLEIMKEGES